MSDQLETVATFGKVWEANLAQNQLNEAGIQSFLEGEHVFQTAPYAADPTGIRLRVSEGDVKRAKEVFNKRSESDGEEH